MSPSAVEEDNFDVSDVEKPEDNKLDAGSIGSVDSLDSLLLENTNLENEIEKRKRCKRGVVYMSFIPPSMTPSILRRLLSEYATIERIYLQPDLKKGKKLFKRKKLRNVKYTEGWLEFLKKRDAKKIAAMLNNTQIGGKKKNKFREYLWNLKYLPRFKWIHLCERLNYERAVKQQKLRAEVSQAKKVASHFADTVEKEERLKKGKWKGPTPAPLPPQLLNRRFTQKETKQDKLNTLEKRDDFIKNLFG